MTQLSVWVQFVAIFCSTSGIGMGTALIGIFATGEFRKQLRTIPRLPLFWPILIFSAAVILSVALAEGTGYAKSVLKLRYFAIYFLLVLFFLNYPAFRERLNKTGFVLCFVLATVAILQFTLDWDPAYALGLRSWEPSPIPQSGNRFFHARGFFFHHNPFGYACLLLFHLMLGLALTGRRIYLVAAGVIVLGILTSASRGTWIALGVSTLVVAVAAGRKHWKVLATVVAILLALVVVVSAGLRGRSQTFSLAQNQDRVRLWTMCVEMFKTSPITGVGFHHGFTVHRQEHMTAAEKTDPSFPSDPHSAYFDLLATTGILGVGAFLWLAIGALRNYVLALRRRESFNQRAYQLAGLGAWVGFLVGSAFDSHLSHTEMLNGTLFFLALGQAASMQESI